MMKYMCLLASILSACCAMTATVLAMDALQGNGSADDFCFQTVAALALGAASIWLFMESRWTAQREEMLRNCNIKR